MCEYYSSYNLQNTAFSPEKLYASGLAINGLDNKEN